MKVELQVTFLLLLIFSVFSTTIKLKDVQLTSRSPLIAQTSVQLAKYQPISTNSEQKDDSNQVT